MKHTVWLSFLIGLATAGFASTEPTIAPPGVSIDAIFGYLVFEATEGETTFSPQSTCNAFCSDDSDCHNACPNCPATFCSGFVCSSSCGGGGGGGGGGGTTCNAFCSDASDCQGVCPAGPQWSCAGYRCVS